MNTVSQLKRRFALGVMRQSVRRCLTRFGRLQDRIHHLESATERLAAVPADPLEAFGHLLCSSLFVLGSVVLMQAVFFHESALSNADHARILVGYVGLPSAIYYLYFLVGDRWRRLTALLAFGVMCSELAVLAVADSGWALIPRLGLFVGSAISMAASTIALTQWPWGQHFGTGRLYWTRVRLEVAKWRWASVKQQLVQLENRIQQQPELRSAIDEY